jgi:hypothetical protein
MKGRYKEAHLEVSFSGYLYCDECDTGMVSVFGATNECDSFFGISASCTTYRSNGPTCQSKSVDVGKRYIMKKSRTSTSVNHTNNVANLCI